jgi:RHS repeat-associated protein
LGSVADVTGISANSLIWSEYYPYGQVRLAGVGGGAPTANPFGFSGEQLDGLTGLHHLRARQYDSGTGRFLTTDPLAAPFTDPYSASYVYARGNPGRYTDPSGEFVFLPLLGIALLGAVAGGGTYYGGLALSNGFQEKPLTEGANFNDFVLSAGFGAATALTGPAPLLLRAALNGGAGVGSTILSQQLNNRPMDLGEISLSMAFGTAGGSIDFGPGMIGFFRGLLGGNAFQALQNYLNDRPLNRGGPNK